MRAAITNATDFSLVDVSGKFIKNESILINGISNGRTITKVDTFGFDDVASIESAVGVSTFAADVGDIDFITAQVVFKFFKYTIRDKNFKPI